MPPRKKVIVQQEIVVPAGGEVSPMAADPPLAAPAPAPAKAKREKKSTKHKVVALVTADGIQGTFAPEQRKPLIVTLPIHSSDIQFHDQPFAYDPNPPTQYDAFNAVVSDPFSAEATYEPATDLQHGGEDTDAAVTAAAGVQTAAATVTASAPKAEVASAHQQQHAPGRKEYGPTTLLVQMATSKHTKELPNQSSLACFWCCENFSGRPCVIPMRIIENVWNVYGNFCTPQCGMAYLLSEILDTHTRWERISLLNRLYGANTNGRVYPAPSRESLQRFGGPITNEDFRAMCDIQRARVDIHMPPMVSILASMDTKPIDFYETPLRNTFASPNQLPAVRHVDEPVGLKLKRNKPLKDKESTLDSVFQKAAAAAAALTA